jgi:hypothetical protein
MPHRNNLLHRVTNLLLPFLFRLERQVVVVSGNLLGDRLATLSGWLCSVRVEHAHERAVVGLDYEVKVDATTLGKVLLELIKLLRAERDRVLAHPRVIGLELAHVPDVDVFLFHFD